MNCINIIYLCLAYKTILFFQNLLNLLVSFKIPFLFICLFHKFQFQCASQFQGTTYKLQYLHINKCYSWIFGPLCIFNEWSSFIFLLEYLQQDILHNKWHSAILTEQRCKSTFFFFFLSKNSVSDTPFSLILNKA